MGNAPNLGQAKTVFDKIWDAHVIRALSDGRALIHIDRQLIHDGSSRQAFDGMRKMGRKVRNLELNVAVVDHIVSSLPGRTGESHPPGIERIHALRDNTRQFGLEYYDVNDPRQGIVHVIAPETALTLPGVTLVCGDSHTATNGALGALAWGIGTTEVMFVMAAQSLLLRKPHRMRINFEGRLAPGVFSKDLILYVIGKHGVKCATGHAVEYAGETIRAMPMEARMTVCNMSIEFGARMGLMGVDDTTLDYVHGRKFAPKGALWDRAATHWRTLMSEDGAAFEQEIRIDCAKVKPQVTWGNSPQDLIAVDEPIPDPSAFADLERREAAKTALAYMELAPGARLEGTPIDYAFIGSCTNSRLSDLEIAAAVVRGRRVPAGIKALVVPGSTQVKAQAESLGLHTVFREAGFEWREAGCSMCQTLGGDFVASGKRCISTSNRNFEGRQGPGARTHLASPAMVAAAAVNGCIVDVRKFLQ
jgi:3-isopropylmalate/(R)-2-methylmalate dehydratase large subunit